MASTTDAPCSSTSAACAGPPSAATARAPQRSEANADGSVPSGGTSPFERTSRPARRGIRSPWAASTAGSARAGTARQDEVVAAELELGGAQQPELLGQLDARQVALVAAGAPELASACSLVRQPRSTSKPGARERDREAGPPRARADDRGAADRRQPAEPLPLEHHARPDPIGDRAGQLRRGVVDPREAERAAGADPDLVRTDPPPASARPRCRSPRPARPAPRSRARAARRRAWACRARPGGCACPPGRSARCPRARGSPWRCRSSPRRPSRA